EEELRQKLADLRALKAKLAAAARAKAREAAAQARAKAAKGRAEARARAKGKAGRAAGGGPGGRIGIGRVDPGSTNVKELIAKLEKVLPGKKRRVMILRGGDNRIEVGPFRFDGKWVAPGIQKLPRGKDVPNLDDLKKKLKFKLGPDAKQWKWGAP